MIVDRLTFEVPGLSPARAHRLAAAIGTMLAGAAPGARDRLTVTLPAGEADDEAIVAAVAAALRGAR